MENKELDRKTIMFVTHEFGLYKGHGGISTYIIHNVNAIIEYTSWDVVVVCGVSGEYNHSKRLRVVKYNSKFNYFNEISDIIENVNPDFIEVSDYLGLLSLFLVKRSLGMANSKACVVTHHHTGTREIWEWGTGRPFDLADFSKARTAALEATQYKLCDKHTATCRFMSDYMSRSPHNLDVSTLYPAFPIEEWVTKAPKRCHIKKEGSLNILCLGRFESRKRQDDLVSSASFLLKSGRDIEVTFVGNSMKSEGNDKDFREECFQKIQRDFRRNFHFFDFISPESCISLYESADIFCIPSQFENFPSTAFEAICLGLPVLARDTTGVSEMVGDSQLCFTSDDRTSLTALLDLACGMSDAQLRNEHSIQLNSLKKICSPEEAMRKRMSFYSALGQRTSEEESVQLSFSPPLVIFQGEVSVSPCSSREEAILLGSRDNFRKDIESSYFIYFPFVPSEDLFRFSLDCARRFRSTEDLLGISDFFETPFTKDDITRFSASHCIIGHIRHHLIEGDLKASDLVARMIVSSSNVYYVFHRNAVRGDFDYQMKEALDKALFKKDGKVNYETDKGEDFYCKNEINDNITLLIHGPFVRFADKIASIAKNCLKNKWVDRVVVSSYEEEICLIRPLVSGCEEISLVEGGEILNPGYFNINCQITLVRNGLSVCDDGVIIKLRSDQIVSFGKVRKIIKKYSSKINDGMLLTTNCYSRKDRLYHPSDMFIIATKKTFLDYYPLRLFSETDLDDRLSMISDAADNMSLTMIQAWPEARLFRNFLRNRGWNLKETHADSFAALKRYCLIVDSRSINLRWKKFLSGKVYLVPYRYTDRPIPRGPVEKARCLSAYDFGMQSRYEHLKTVFIARFLLCPLQNVYVRVKNSSRRVSKKGKSLFVKLARIGTGRKR